MAEPVGCEYRARGDVGTTRPVGGGVGAGNLLGKVGDSGRSILSGGWILGCMSGDKGAGVTRA